MARNRFHLTVRCSTYCAAVEVTHGEIEGTTSLDVIETAIRNAFGKGDATDRAYREKVYRSAFAALDRALKANPNVTVETAINRRKSLQAKIAEIETEFLPAAPAVEPEGAAAPVVAPPVEPERATDVAAAESVLAGITVSADANAPKAATPTPEIRIDAPGPAAMPVAPARPAGEIAAERREPVLAGDPSPQQPAADPREATPSSPTAEVPPQRERVVDDERRRPYMTALVILVLLAAVGGGVWWGWQNGLFETPSTLERARTMPQVDEGEDFDPDEEPLGAPARQGDADAQRNWITVFAPGDPASVNAPADARAEVMQDDGASFMRIRSGGSGSAILFDVGQGVLERLAGKRAVFDLVARAEEGKETQISIDCNFGELGDCGRKRYAVGYEKGDYLFEIELPATDPGAGGTIAVNTDIGNGGKAIDVYEIKVSVAE